MKNQFIDRATTTIQHVVKTMQERGSQYADTWGEAASWNITKAIKQAYINKSDSDKFIEAISLAAFVDQKYSRFTGGYKRDTAIDLISYLAALVNCLDSLDKEVNKQ